MHTRIVGPANAGEAVDTISAAPVIAIDTEFHAENLYYPRLYLVQVHVPGTGTWFIDPLDDETFRRVSPALLAPTWAVHAGGQDLRILSRALGGLPARIWDVQIGAGLCGGGYPSSWNRLLQRFLGVTVAKTETLSDWSRRPLSVAQLGYAADDVERLLPLLDVLHARLAAQGRSAVFAAACDEARQLALAPDDEDLWRPLAGTSHFTAEQASILRELTLWRETVARREDRPARTILSDGLLKDLARHTPAHPDALRTNRRFPAAVVKRHGDDLLSTIAAGRARAASDPPIVIEPESVAFRRLLWFQAWAQALGHAEDWSPRLVLPDRVLASAAANRPELSGWRAELVRDALSQATAGRHALALEDDVRLT